MKGVNGWGPKSIVSYASGLFYEPAVELINQVNHQLTRGILEGGRRGARIMGMFILMRW